MIAVHTKFIPATNTRAAKIKAYTCNGHKPVMVSIDYALDDVQRHAKAAKALLDREMKYAPDYSTMAYGGSSDDKGYTFCFIQSTVTM
jgi:hypothetical protein